jgi:4-O-beta-D-mannosyl-D-glucose phosphorylase
MKSSPLFTRRLTQLRRQQQRLLASLNRPDPTTDHGIFERFRDPVLTPRHVPLTWRYDLNPRTNPHLLERLGINAVFNAGAMRWQNKVIVVARVEGWDRKSFFAVAESRNGLDRFRFWDEPLVLPETGDPDINVYDMRLTQHADGWIYGLFCTERKDPAAPASDTSSAIAQCGIARTRDLRTWERLPDLKSASSQQRNVVLHPDFVDGQYLLYTRPQDGFIDTGSGGGISWGLTKTMERAALKVEKVLDPRAYHTIKEVKNGMGPPPLRTRQGWLHIDHGVRNTAAGLRYVLYASLCDLHEPWRILHQPAGYLIAPEGAERVGDVSNVVFSNGAVQMPDGTILIYYASSDTRLHVARTDVDRMLDYVTNTPADGGRSAASVQQRLDLIQRNRKAAARTP